MTQPLCPFPDASLPVYQRWRIKLSRFCFYIMFSRNYPSLWHKGLYKLKKKKKWGWNSRSSKIRVCGIDLGYPKTPQIHCNGYWEQCKFSLSSPLHFSWKKDSFGSSILHVYYQEHHQILLERNQPSPAPYIKPAQECLKWMQLHTKQIYILSSSERWQCCLAVLNKLLSSGEVSGWLTNQRSHLNMERKGRI